MFYILFILCLLVTDQVSKYLTVKNLVEYESYSVIKNILSFTRIHNTGGPWSIFENTPFVFIFMTLIVLTIGFIYFKKHKPTHLLEKLSICMIAGGALGNFADRIIRGYVVDMIDVNFFNYPVFNIADCYIVVGAILMCFYVIFLDNKNN